MGTNFYLHASTGEPCSCCGRSDPTPEPLHVGKDSGGWRFLLHSYLGHEGEPARLTTAGEWWSFLNQRLNAGDVLRDEYGNDWTLAQLGDRMRETKAASSHLEYPSPSLYVDPEGWELKGGTWC